MSRSWEEKKMLKLCEVWGVSAQHLDINSALFSIFHPCDGYLSLLRTIFLSCRWLTLFLTVKNSESQRVFLFFLRNDDVDIQCLCIFFFATHSDFHSTCTHTLPQCGKRKLLLFSALSHPLHVLSLRFKQHCLTLHDNAHMFADIFSSKDAIKLLN